MSDIPKITELMGPDAIEYADRLIDDIGDSYDRKRLRDAKSRIDLAMIAASIAQDRYSAGSIAAVVTIYILLTRGLEAAKHFADDLEHHER
jgi:hypothetical protein